MTESAAALELCGISKRFGAVQANRAVDLRLARGEIHALMGENGAGKSTLMKIAYGLVRPDRGSVAIGGQTVSGPGYGPARAIALGVGMVHQHFMLVPTLTVAENVMLGHEPTRWGALDRARVAAELDEIGQRHGIAVDPDAIVEELSVGEQQRVEILKVLWRRAEVLILDEPTAVLTPGEVRRLFDVLRSLAAEGVSVVIITHKIDEVLDLADRVTVMRQGRRVAELAGSAIEPTAIVPAMIGRPAAAAAGTDSRNQEIVPPFLDFLSPSPVLEIRDLVVAGRGGKPAVAGVSLEVRGGEIVGIAGVQGNGQTELVEAIAGLRRVRAGAILLGGVDVTGESVRPRQRRGLAHIPEDRHARGLVLEFSLAENVLLGEQDRFARRLRIERAALEEHARALFGEYDVRPAALDAPARTLSGGNQQKLVVARELGRERPLALLCAQPTRGVDVGAIERIHQQIAAARKRGLAILLVSAELSELQALADRVLVIYEGRIAGELDGDALRAPDAFERIGHLMTGAGAP